MHFTQLIDELDRPDIHVNDLISVLEDSVRALNTIKRIADSGLDYHEATALNRMVNRSQTKLQAILDRVQAEPADELAE